MNEKRRSGMVLILIVAAVSGSGACIAHEGTPEGGQRSFFADRRAYRPGDMLTVLITEFSTVSTTARTRTNKGESAEASILQDNGVSRGVAAAFDSRFAGGGEIERSGKLLAKLAVTVEGVDDLGN